jgi:hypothetical protein
MSQRKAIFTILFGADYIKRWQLCAEAGWRAYAARHGYDLVLVDGPIKRAADLPARPIHWQKLFIPQHPAAARYERIVFLDADIMINYHRAPCIVAATPPDKVGVVRFDRYIDDPMTYYLAFIRRYKIARYASRCREMAGPHKPLCLTGPDYATAYAEFTARRDLPLLNTGVIVMHPAAHAAAFEQIYLDSFRELRDGAADRVFEQNYVAWKLIDAGLAHYLDERFNTIAYLEQALHYPFLDLVDNPPLQRLCYSTMLANCWFLHFAANAHLMPLAVINEEREFAMFGLKDIYRADREYIPDRRRGAAPRGPVAGKDAESAGLGLQAEWCPTTGGSASPGAAWQEAG